MGAHASSACPPRCINNLSRSGDDQRHTVTVAPDGFDWQGMTYRSLSAIARAITGTAWSGPRFFALAPGNATPTRRSKKKSMREGRDARIPRTD